MSTPRFSSDFGALRRPIPTARQRAAGMADPTEEATAGPADIPADARELSKDEISRDRSLPWRTRIAAYFSSIDPRHIAGPRLPLIVFATSGALSGWSVGAIVIAGPEIQADFGTSIAALTAISSATGILLLLLGLPLGFLVDRVSRVRLVQIAAWGGPIGTLIQATARTFGVFTAGNLVTSMVSIPNQIASGPLLADYYPARSRARAFGIIALGGSIGGIISTPVTGFLVARFGWRSTTLALLALALISAVLTLLLKEPVRGAMDRADYAAATGKAAADSAQPGAQIPPSFGEALRAAWSIRTLRLQAIAGFVNSFSMPLTILLGLLVASKFALGPFERSLLATATSLVTLPALVIGAGIADRLLRHKPSSLVALQAGFQFVSSLALIAQALAPNLFFFFLASTIPIVVSTVLSPISFTISSMIVPARLRGAGMQVFTPFSIIGLLLAPVMLTVARDISLETAFMMFSPFLAASGLIYLASAGSVAADIRTARAAAAAEEDSVAAAQENKDKILIARDVQVRLGAATILNSVDFDVSKNEILALSGTNGSGKSTLLKSICSLVETTNGAVLFAGRNITHVPTHELVRLGLVYVPGGDGVLPHLSVADNLAIALARGNQIVAARRAAGIATLPEVSLADIYDTFPDLRAASDKLAGDLSGGEQQMVAIAQGLALRPQLLMIDEFSLGLAPAVVATLMAAVRRLGEQGVAIVVVEQSLNVVAQLTDNVVYMDQGTIIYRGSMQGLLDQPDLVASTYLGRSQAKRLRKRSASDAPALELRSLSCQRGDTTVLDDIDLAIAPGEIIGVIGTNGAGKTTLFDAISGFIPLASGSITIGGVDVSAHAPYRRAEAGLARAFQDAALYGTLTVAETIAVAAHAAGGGGAIAAIIGGGRSRRQERATWEKVEELMELTGLTRIAQRRISHISTGMRRAVDLACQLAANPVMLLLDEPASGLAQAEVEALAPMIARIGAQTGCGIAVIEHDLPLLARACHSFIAMHRGAIVARGSLDEVWSHPDIAAWAGTDPNTIARSGSHTFTPLSSSATVKATKELS